MPTIFSKSPYAHATYSGADMLVTLNIKNTSQHKNATCVLGELQTLSYSTHMERSGVRKLGNVNVTDFTNGPRTIAGSLVFAVFDRHVMRAVIDQMGVSQEVLPDELPPFDITITYANEYGKNSVLRIYGVRLVNEGQVCSVNDVYMENTYQYVASNIQPLERADLRLLDTSASDESANEEKNQDDVQSNNTSTIKDQINNTIDNSNSSNGEKILPKLIAKKVDAYICFDVTLKEEALTLIVTDGNKDDKGYNVSTNNWPLHLKLDPGNYHITLKSTLKDIYDAIPLTVGNEKPILPIITNITSTSISGKVQQDITTIVISDHNAYNKIFELKNVKTFTIEDLVPDTFYYIQTKNEFNTLSDTMVQKTLIQKSDVFSDFEFFINYNNYMNQEIKQFISLAKEQAKISKDNFLNAFYKMYLDSKEKTTNLEFLMHLVSYFDLAYKQKEFHFEIKNRWLNQIEPHLLATYYKVYGEDGITFNGDQLTGMIKHHQLYNDTLEKISTYKPHRDYQHKIQKDYANVANNYTELKNIFNMRYGVMPIDTTYGFYDHMLYTDGAYIEIDNNTLKPHLEFSAYEIKDTYFVFKEDIHLGISFKVRAETQIISLNELSFFNPSANYIVYLEANNEAISKSIVVKENNCNYIYDSLYSLSIGYKMQDITNEICTQNLDALSTFIYGFYLLVNRKKINIAYVEMFDEWLFNRKKLSPVKYYVHENTIFFDEEVILIHFDKHGELLKITRSNLFNLSVLGYLVWFTSMHQMSLLDFNNI